MRQLLVTQRILRIVGYTISRGDSNVGGGHEWGTSRPNTAVRLLHQLWLACVTS